MAATATFVGFYDISDPHAFVHATINRAKLVLSPEKRDELHAEGMAILCKLAVDYKPHIDGHAQEGRFSGFAAMYLPRKLGDAWHRMHENHRLVTDPATGKRRWRYEERAASLEALLADDPDRSSLMAAAPTETDLAKRLGSALDEHWQRQRQIIVRVGELLGSGATPADVASMEGLSPDIVRECVLMIQRVAHRLESEDS